MIHRASFLNSCSLFFFKTLDMLFYLLPHRDLPLLFSSFVVGFRIPTVPSEVCLLECVLLVRGNPVLVLQGFSGTIINTIPKKEKVYIAPS